MQHGEGDKDPGPRTVGRFTGGQVLLSDAQAEYDEVVAYYSANGYELNDEEAIRSIKDEIVHYLVENKVVRIKPRELGLLRAERGGEKRASPKPLKRNTRRPWSTMVYFRAMKGQDPRSAGESSAYLAENSSPGNGGGTALSDAWQNKLNEYVTADVTASEDQINAA